MLAFYTVKPIIIVKYHFKGFVFLSIMKLALISNKLNKN